MLMAEAKAWVVNLPYQKPVELGYANEVWTYSLLRDHIRKQASRQDHPALVRATESMVHEMLARENQTPSDALLSGAPGCGFQREDSSGLQPPRQSHDRSSTKDRYGPMPESA